ncbi:MAG: YjjW family glycine radical enzyme activase [Erysipelotrichaceae bacterium]
MIATINKIIPFSNVDGEGNRIAIFFQKCPFACLYCHNPETIALCTHCGKCVPTCPSQALTIVNNQVVWDESLCTQCGTCLQVCPFDSSPKTKAVTVEQLFTMIQPYLPFVRGVTVSGGECMEYAPFLTAFAKVLEPTGKSLLIDSNGFYPFAQYPELLAHSRGVMLDIKATDPLFHKTLTGQDLSQTQANLRYLLSVDKLVEVRTVCLPNQDEQNRKTILETLAIIGPNIPYKLLAYRPYGVKQEHLQQLGTASISREKMLEYQRMCEENGYFNTIVI